MTRESYNRATGLIDKIEKTKRVMNKISSELPESQYDPDYKMILSPVIAQLEDQIKALQEIFDDL